MKQFDVAVLGSTGFTGRLVCRHIVQRYHGKVRSLGTFPVWLVLCASPLATNERSSA